MNSPAVAAPPVRAANIPDPLPDSAGARREAFALGRELFMLRIRQAAVAAGLPAFIHALAGGSGPNRPATLRFLVIDGGAGRAECAVTEQMLAEYADGAPRVDAEIGRITQRLVCQLKAPYRPTQAPIAAARGPHAPERRARPRTSSYAIPR